MRHVAPAPPPIGPVLPIVPVVRFTSTGLACRIAATTSAATFASLHALCVLLNLACGAPRGEVSLARALVAEVDVHDGRAGVVALLRRLGHLRLGW